jgi:hypothetical protein
MPGLLEKTVKTAWGNQKNASKTGYWQILEFLWCGRFGSFTANLWYYLFAWTPMAL